VATAKNVLFHVFDIVLLGLKLFQAQQQYPARAVSFSPDPAQPSAFLRKKCVEAASASNGAAALIHAHHPISDAR
jgi:hypothetical protein